jgi:DNA-directed RNA polymerase specialized sigma24 family protein
MAQDKNYPKTMPEFVAAGWYDNIMRKVRKYNLNDACNSYEDLVQDIFVQLLVKDKNGRNYLERFDPSFERKFDAYIYVLVVNAVKKRGMREGTAGGRLIVNALSLEMSQSDSDEPTPGVVYADRLQLEDSADDLDGAMSLEAMIARATIELGEYKASSSVTKADGTVINRDPLTVFQLLWEEGLTVPEIAELFETSKQFIYNLLNKIRQTPAFAEWHAELVANNAISSAGKRKVRAITV